MFKITFINLCRNNQCSNFFYLLGINQFVIDDTYYKQGGLLFKTLSKHFIWWKAKQLAQTTILVCHTITNN